MYDGILLRDGKYHVYIKIQDGTETYGWNVELQKAKEMWLEGHKLWNGVERNLDEVHVYELKAMVEYKLVRLS